jgi:hypothetical protein
MLTFPDIRAETRASYQQLEELESRSGQWALYTRSLIRGEMQSLLNKVDRYKVDFERITADLEASQYQCEVLQAKTNALWHAMGHMVPQADLEQARAAHAELAAKMDQLSVLEHKMQEEISSMTFRLQAKQNDIDQLLKELQVVFLGQAVPLSFLGSD